MLSGAEQARTQMDSKKDDLNRIHAAAQIDRNFGSYQIDMSPDEALAFAELTSSPSIKLDKLIERINAVIPPINFGPEHKKTGKTHHFFRIGRRNGFRFMDVEIFIGFFQVDYDFMSLLEGLHVLGTGEGTEVLIEADNNSYSVRMHWNRKV